MRLLLRFALAVVATLTLASVASADRPDKDRPDKAQEKAEKAAEKADKALEKAQGKADKAAEKGTKPRDADNDDSSDDGAEDAPAPKKGGKGEDADGDGLPDGKFEDHPVGGPPGLLKKPGEPAHPEHTKFAERVGAEPTGGTIQVRLPGAEDFVPLSTDASLPVGTVVDATEGLVEVMSEAAPDGTEQNAVVAGGVFRIAQDKASGITDLKLQGGDFSACGAKGDDDDEDADVPAARAASKGKRGGKKRKGGQVARGIWAAGKGRFRTSGRHSAATVRGTRWATVDRCQSTTTKVFEGVVDVRDFETGRTITLRAGERHVARERRG
jgi:hypothetical protein